MTRRRVQPRPWRGSSSGRAATRARELDRLRRSPSFRHLAALPPQRPGPKRRWPVLSTLWPVAPTTPRAASVANDMNDKYLRCMFALALLTGACSSGAPATPAAGGADAAPDANAPTHTGLLSIQDMAIHGAPP